MAAVFGLVLVTAGSVSAQFYDGTTLKTQDLSAFIEKIEPGSIVLLGEAHNLSPIRDQQMEILAGLRSRHLPVSVGLEFLNYTDQSFVNQFRSGQIDEATFKFAVKWTGYDFANYRDQLLFPLTRLGEFGLGINLSREITKQITRGGLESLTEDQKKLLPPNFEVGRDSYKARYFKAVGDHIPPEMLENSFIAQSAWDDTMAWQATEFIKANSKQVLVIVVGEFHVQFGGGLPDRIHARLPEVKVHTLSQVWAEGLTNEEVQAELQPSGLEGPRADYIWVSRPTDGVSF